MGVRGLQSYILAKCPDSLIPVELTGELLLDCSLFLACARTVCYLANRDRNLVKC